MKLEEGMYVRTEEGEISKIKWITVQRWEGLDNTIEANFMLENKDHIEYPRDNFKASHKLIDLIEVGDYVNGGYVLDFETLQTGEKTAIVDGLINYGWGQGVIPVSEIKSIVTKEQFESMKYEVKEDE